jgi:dTDP-4-amino-4,6-dideoxygalactose transaminase
MKVPFFRFSAAGGEIDNVRAVLESGWLTTASKAREFETRFAEAVGAHYACAVNSCTAALHLAAEAMGISRGDKVFVPTMTFTSTAEVVRYLGADPVLLDVDYNSCLVTPERLRRAIQSHPEVKTLFIVHYGGQPAQMLPVDNGQGILGICREHGIRIIEDAAHAFPSRIGERMVGSLGDATCFSFYANKTMTTGEGGMLTTDNEAIWKRAKVMRLHGIDRDIWSRFTAETQSWEYDVVAPGFKYNMPDVNAAIGLAQLQKVYAMRDERQRCALRYLSKLAEIDYIDLPELKVDPAWHAWHLFPIVLKPDAPLSRNELIQNLAQRGIGTSVHYKPIHRMSYYRDRYGLEPAQFPDAERIWSGCISLPIYPSLQNEEVDYVCSSINEALGR